jgi:hypothetical protein
MNTRDELRMSFWCRAYNDASLRKPGDALLERPATNCAEEASTALAAFDQMFPEPEREPRCAGNPPPDDGI